MRLSVLSFLILAIASTVSAAPIGSYSGLSDIFGRDYAPPTVVERRGRVVLPPNAPPYPPHPPHPPLPSPSASGGSHYFPRAFVPLPISLPLGTPNDLARCPTGGLACPVTQRSADTSSSDEAYACVSPAEDLFSCGGCTTLGTGTDCSTIPNVKSVSCAAAKCQVYSCKPGYTVSSSGTGCTSILAKFQ